MIIEKQGRRSDAGNAESSLPVREREFPSKPTRGPYGDGVYRSNPNGMVPLLTLRESRETLFTPRMIFACNPLILQPLMR
jgi:hypothetical protein